MRGTTIRLAVTFAGAIAAFVGSTVVAQQASRGIDVDALSISDDAAPGVEVVSAIRAEVRALETLVVRHVVGAPVSEREIGASRERIEGRLEQALALPASREEAQLLATLNRSLRAFDESVERALEQSRAGRTQQARDTEREVSARAEEAIRNTNALIDYNAAQAREAARRIEDQHHHATVLAYELDAIAALLVILAAVFALRALKQVHQLQDAHRVTIERKAQELELFAGRVAHDVLGPLSTVGMSLAIAGRQLPAPARDTIARGESSLQRVRRIVDGLLDFARSGATPDPASRADVATVVNGLREELAPVAAQQEAELVIEPFSDATAACSPGVLISILSNLMRNAFKYLGDSSVRRVTLRIRRRRQVLIFEVEDTGPGIPEPLRDGIFNPYVRGHHPGTPGIGLGLATVKRLADGHGGATGVRASPSGGALFWVELPASSASPDVMPQVPTDAEESSKRSQA